MTPTVHTKNRDHPIGITRLSKGSYGEVGSYFLAHAVLLYDVPFSLLYYILDMRYMSERAAKTIRMKEELYHQARVAAVISRKSLGQWIEEAIAEKLRAEAVALPSDPKGQTSTQAHQSRKTKEGR